ncbi:MAG: TolC family protein [Defluviitaleaceae bacterium]|nr:TolC family protein [Defluviitaleaceae bacterium]
MKKIIAIFLCAVMIFATPIAAQADYGLPGGGLEGRIAELEAQLAALMGQLSGGGTDHAALSRQRREAEHLEQFMYNMTYYGVVLTIAHNDLLIRQRELTARQIALENVRLELGFTTQRNLDYMAAELTALERQIELNRDTIQAERQLLGRRRARYGQDFRNDFVIPTPSRPDVRNADALRTRLIENNASLAVLEGHMGRGVGWSEMMLMEEQRNLLTRQLELSAVTAWNNYLDARSAHELAVSEQSLRRSRLELIDEMFELGEISEVDRMAMRFGVYVEQFAADAAAVALAVSVAEIELMMRGVAAG